MFKLLLNLYILQFVLSQDFPTEDLLIVQDACRVKSLIATQLLHVFALEGWELGTGNGSSTGLRERP